MSKIGLFCLLSVFMYTSGQRITTIHLDGVQYFISRMNPYSPELNYFLAYQYCRSLGLQLASFETKEKALSMTTYLKNAGYGNYDFWTSGNRLGTGMFLWMSTGLPFNATFDFFENSVDAIQPGLLDPVDHNSNTSPQRTARDSSSGAEKGCVILKQPTLKWMPEDCSTVKDFICEQTRCYYYNYGSIPVSSAQGRPITSTTMKSVVAYIPFQKSTTPLPILKKNAYTSAVKDKESENRTSFISLHPGNERAFDDRISTVDNGNQPLGSDIHMNSDNDEHIVEHYDNDNNNNNDNDNNNDVHDTKDHFSFSTNGLHSNAEAHSSNENSHEINKGFLESDAIQEDDDTENNDNSASYEEEHYIGAKSEENMSLETGGVEVRLKEISQEIQRKTSNDNFGNNHANHHDNDDISRQSFLSLTDLIRTLRPNEKQIIPQIDSDYSNAMRVLGEGSGTVNNGESRKVKKM